MAEPRPNEPDIVDCPMCGGSGERNRSTCRDCGGRGWFSYPLEKT